MSLRPLGAMFDEELSPDEALAIYVDREKSGTAGAALFMAVREMVLHLKRQNGNFDEFQETLLAHLNKHPASEVVQKHMDDAHDASVGRRLMQRLGRIGSVGIAGLIVAFGGGLTVLQIIQLIRTW